MNISSAFMRRSEEEDPTMVEANIIRNESEQ
jgi:hypothetical protein